MLLRDRAEHFAAPCTTETTNAVSDLCRIGAGMDVGSIDASLKTFCRDTVATLRTVEDLPMVEVFCLLIREEFGDLLGAQLVEEGSDQIYC